MTGIYCAIDTSDIEEAKQWVQDLSVLPLHIKLGLQFFMAQGVSGVHDIRSMMSKDAQLFLDVKLHDIPNTVAGAVKSIASCRPDFMTIHTAGGFDMMQSCVNATKDISEQTGLPPIKILGVTVLTHLDQGALSTTGIDTPLSDVVLKRAILAHKSGLSGVVCSPHELKILRSNVPDDFLLITPGVRLKDTKTTFTDDQTRTMTPKEAVDLGADYLVVGRPIMNASDPIAAAQQILSSISQ